MSLAISQLSLEAIDEAEDGDIVLVEAGGARYLLSVFRYNIYDRNYGTEH